MSISRAIAPHLPYLRRFGRALTGRQDSGDAYVVTVLESFLADPQGAQIDGDARIVLYRRFLKIWNSVSMNHSRDVQHTGLASSSTAASGGEPQDYGARSLSTLTPLPRQAFLLTSVEGFTTKQAASILELPEVEVSQLLNQAGQEIARQVATDVLIIEDEPMIALDLEGLVEGLGHRVCGLARTRAEAIAAVHASRPGLVLADIQLADGSSGLDTVNEILLGFDVPVIFITAFPERLLTGERPEPTFLITKPFQTNTVRAIISQALFFGLNASLPGSRVGSLS